MNYEQCIAAVKAAVGEDLKDEEIESLISSIRIRREQRRITNPLESDQAALAKVTRDLADEQKIVAALAKRDQVVNTLRRVERRAKYGEGDEAKQLSQKNVGQGKSVASEARSLESELTAGLIKELEAGKYERLLSKRNPDFERAIAKDMWAVTEGKLLKGSAEVQAIAKIFSKYQEMARVMQNEAGAFITKLPGYIVRQSHDMFKIRRAGEAAWREFIQPLLAERTFKGVENRDEFLKNIFNELSTGEFYRVRGDNKTERTLHFKDSDAWFDYNERFGNRSLTEGVITGLQHAGQNAALMRTWGTNPTREFMSDKTWLSERAARRGDNSQTDALKNWRIESEFDQISGQANIPGSPSMARYASMARAVLNLAHLGGVVLSSLPDIAASASTVRHQGIGFLESYGNTLTDFVRGRGTTEQKAIMRDIGHGIDGMIGSMARRFSLDESLPGFAARASNFFYKANLLSWWTDSKATGAGLIMSNNLARQQGKAFGQLDKGLQELLSRHGIDANRWELLRQVDAKTANGQKYMTPDLIRQLDIDPKEKREIEIGLREFFANQIDTAITQGGAKERALISWGTRPGTAIGEATRFIMQYKLYPVTFATRHLSREYGARGVPGAIVLIAEMTALGFLSLQAKELAKGLTPKDPNSIQTWLEAMKQGGGGGIYGDLLLNEYGKFGGGTIESLGGPAVSTAAHMAMAFGKAREALVEEKKGAGTSAAKELLQGGKGVVPFVNLFYAKSAIDYLLIYHLQEAMNPGYLKRFEKKVRDGGQDFILNPPSDTIARGGGFR